MSDSELKKLKKQLKELGISTDEQKEEKQDTKDDADVDGTADKIADKIVNAINEAKQETPDKDTKEQYKILFGKSDPVGYPDNLDKLNKDQKIVFWFKSLLEKDRSAEADHVFKALVEGTDTQGGYLVPEEFRAEVFRIMPDYSVMRNLARVIPMNTDTLNLNTLDARPKAYWTSEYAEKTTSSAEFGRVTLSPNDLVCLLPVTHQLIADANINVVQFITQLFTEEIARAEDEAFFTGSGTGQPQGIDSCSGINTYAAGGVLDFDDTLSALYSVPQSIRNSPGAAFVASAKVIQILRKVQDDNGQYIWQPDVGVEGREGIHGKPVYEQNDIAEDELYFGDWSYYIIGDRQQLTVETTREGGDAWRRNATEIKAVERVDGKCVKADAFVKVSGIQS